MELKHIGIDQLSVSLTNMRVKGKSPDIANILPSVRVRGVFVPLIVRANGSQVVIPARRGRRHPALHDRDKDRLRNRIERLFNKLENWRRIAIRYDKPENPIPASSASPQSNYGCPLST